MDCSAERTFIRRGCTFRTFREPSATPSTACLCPFSRLVFGLARAFSRAGWSAIPRLSFAYGVASRPIRSFIGIGPA
eukprot:92630-Alexandrium_andersonii.AAC.1